MTTNTTTTTDAAEANRRLIAKRKLLAAEAQKPRTPEATTGLEAACQRLLEQAEEARNHRREWELWSRGRLQAKVCAVHPGSARPVDIEASVRESYHGKTMVLVYAQCAQCRAILETPQSWIVRAGVPLELATATLANWTPRTPDDAAVLAAVRLFAKQRMGTLMLMGGWGLGKSHLAVGVMQQMHCGWFISQTDLLNKIRLHHYHEAGAYDPEEKAKAARLLVVDELGLSSGGKDELPFLHSILNHRHGNLLPTVLTGNLDLKGLVSVVGDRMYDRLKQSAKSIQALKGQSMRGLLKEGYAR